MVRLRRLSQIVFLALFVFLVFETGFDPSRLKYPVSWLLQIDPLSAVSNALATGTLYRGLLWSLVVLIPTFFLGRFFCGWVCPLGTLNHAVGALRRRGRRLVESNRYQRWQRLKYYLLAALLAAALAGSGALSVLDPISLAVRSTALSLLPALDHALAGYAPLSFKQLHFRQGLALGLIFITVLLLNLRFTRFWCRALCPLGALLGLASRWSIVNLRKRPGGCGDCNRCLLHCQGGDDPLPGARWRKAECHLCLNCVADCPEKALSFGLFAPDPAALTGPDLGRRRALASFAAGAATVPLFRSPAGFKVDFSERLIRPPGALGEPEFLARCIRCGQCMKVCPNNALHPALFEAGLEGLWTPVLVPRIGYCEPSCVLCGEVCPTGAIWEISAREKAWEKADSAASPIRIGTAFYDHGRCLPWSMATECIVCEEWCPTSPKAIYLRPAEVIGPDGKPRSVRQPYVDPERCVGCGACEYACPVKDRPAVYVTSIGESRSLANQILLKQPARPPAPPLPDSGVAPGWIRTGEVRVFDAASLWQHLDGGADKYVQAGVERTWTAPYRHRDGIEVTADVHLMRAPAGAAKLMDGEPAVGSRPVALGDAGRLYSASLIFRRGRYLVRLTAFQPAENALLELARAIESRLAER